MGAYRYYLCSIERENTLNEFGWSNHDALYLSHGPAKAKTLVGAIDEASNLAERLHKPVHVFHSWQKCSVPKKPMTIDEFRGLIDRTDYVYVLDENTVRRTYMTTTDELLAFFDANSIEIHLRVRGNQDHDDDTAKMYEDIREQFAEEDALDTDFVMSCTNYNKWEYREKWGGLSPIEVMHDIFKDRTTIPDIERFVKGHVWIDGSVAYKSGPVAKAFRITICRFGFDLHIVFGEASEEERKQNRFASAVVGFAPKDFGKADVAAQSPTTLMIAEEWIK